MNKFFITLLAALALAVLNTDTLPADGGPGEALFSAVADDDRAAFENALEKGADANSTSGKGAHILAAATLAKRHDMAMLLLEAGANPDAQHSDYYSATTLMLTVATGDIALATELINAGADVDFRDENGDPAINWAAYYGKPEFVSLFLAHGAATQLIGHGNALEISMRRGHQDLVLMLARHDNLALPTPDAALLIDAVQAGDHAATKDALAVGISADSLDFTGRPVLALAARQGHATVVSALIENGATVDMPDNIGFTPLMEAARDNQIETTRLLLAAGANPGHIAETSGLSLGVIHMAALSGAPEMVDLIADLGVDLNLQGREGGTALLWCLGEGRFEAAARLLEAGANPYIENSGGVSAVTIIAGSKSEKLKSLLKPKSTYGA